MQNIMWVTLRKELYSVLCTLYSVICTLYSKNYSYVWSIFRIVARVEQYLYDFCLVRPFKVERNGHQ